MLVYQKLSILKTGVHTLVFGVDNPQENQLRAMVSGTNSVLQASGFDDIQRLESKLVSLICVQAEPGQFRSN